jgi:hypothetical protein
MVALRESEETFGLIREDSRCTGVQETPYMLVFLSVLSYLDVRFCAPDVRFVSWKTVTYLVCLAVITRFDCLVKYILNVYEFTNKRR